MLSALACVGTFFDHTVTVRVQKLAALLCSRNVVVHKKMQWEGTFVAVFIIFINSLVFTFVHTIILASLIHGAGKLGFLYSYLSVMVFVFLEVGAQVS
jgi:hypothetical protein